MQHKTVHTGDAVHGEAKRAHGEAEAERWLQAAMEALGVQVSQLPETAKVMMEKTALAWWLRQRMTAKRQWICEWLSMGEVSAVTRAIRLVKGGQHAEAKPMVKRLMKLSASE